MDLVSDGPIYMVFVPPVRVVLWDMHVDGG